MRKTVLFYLGLSDAVGLSAEGFQFCFGFQVQKVGVEEGNTSSERPKMTLYILPLCLCNQASEPGNRGLLEACLKTNHIVIVPIRDYKCTANLKYNVRHGKTQKSWHNSISLQQLMYG